ncbi:hypothetical protein NDU88_001643 [Pleurodeles waltl]|uniref:Uncharacterized protein n=1 Tax=Pleurodeles waltl TaxID=8319 RepID=A0AAV7U865_PLEWA|nr:hypothetical protein NDU88_001643 [Pleurodeles waltl]
MLSPRHLLFFFVDITDFELGIIVQRQGPVYGMPQAPVVLGFKFPYWCQSLISDLGAWATAHPFLDYCEVSTGGVKATGAAFHHTGWKKSAAVTGIEGQGCIKQPDKVEEILARMRMESAKPGKEWLCQKIAEEMEELHSECQTGEASGALEDARITGAEQEMLQKKR